MPCISRCRTAVKTGSIVAAKTDVAIGLVHARVMLPDCVAGFTLRQWTQVQFGRRASRGEERGIRDCEGQVRHEVGSGRSWSARDRCKCGCHWSWSSPPSKDCAHQPPMNRCGSGRVLRRTARGSRTSSVPCIVARRRFGFVSMSFPMVCFKLRGVRRFPGKTLPACRGE